MRTTWTCHLIFSAHGIQRMTKGPPSLRTGERAVRVRLKVPPGLFARAFPEAVVEVPEEAVVKPVVETLPVEGSPAP